jgi:hypothetical protein
MTVDLSLADGIGMLGAALIVTAYFLLQVGRLEAHSVSFSVVNGLGAFGILFSLAFEFNLSAFLIELFWLAISIYGAVRALRSRSARPVSVAKSSDDPAASAAPKNP